MHRIDAFLELAREQGCSDIHFAVGQPPLVRMDGQLAPLKYRILSADETEAILDEILPANRREELLARGSTDLSYWGTEIGRFRINVFRKHTGWGAACRVLPVAVPELSRAEAKNLFLHFGASLTLCGLIAAAYPFFTGTALGTWAFYPAFLRPGAATVRDRATALMTELGAELGRALARRERVGMQRDSVRRLRTEHDP